MEFKQRTLVGEDGPSCLAEHGRRALDQLAAGKETHARLNPAIRQFPGGTGDRIQAQAASAAVVVIDPVQSGIDQFLCVPQQIIHLGLAGRDAVFIIIDGIAEFGMMPFVLKDPVILPGIRAGRRIHIGIHVSGIGCKRLGTFQMDTDAPDLIRLEFAAVAFDEIIDELFVFRGFTAVLFGEHPGDAVVMVDRKRIGRTVGTPHVSAAQVDQHAGMRNRFPAVGVDPPIRGTGLDRSRLESHDQFERFVPDCRLIKNMDADQHGFAFPDDLGGRFVRSERPVFIRIGEPGETFIEAADPQIGPERGQVFRIGPFADRLPDDALLLFQEPRRMEMRHALDPMEPVRHARFQRNIQRQRFRFPFFHRVEFHRHLAHAVVIIFRGHFEGYVLSGESRFRHHPVRTLFRKPEGFFGKIIGFVVHTETNRTIQNIDTLRINGIPEAFARAVTGLERVDLAFAVIDLQRLERRDDNPVFADPVVFPGEMFVLERGGLDHFFPVSTSQDGFEREFPVRQFPGIPEGIEAIRFFNRIGSRQFFLTVEDPEPDRLDGRIGFHLRIAAAGFHLVVRRIKSEFEFGIAFLLHRPAVI